MGSAVGPADAMQASNRKQATFFCRFFKAKYRYRSSWKSNSTISRFSSKKIFLRRLPGFSTKTGMTEPTIGSQTGPDNSRKLVSIFASSIVRIWYPFLAACKTALHQENKLSKNRNGAGNLHHGEQHRESRYHCHRRHHCHTFSCRKMIVPAALFKN
jgi:hypothetical protein